MEGRIVLFQGRRGCGKTLGLVYQALNFHSNGWTIMSNFNLSVPFQYTLIDDDFLFSLNKTSSLKNCLILIDEMQIFFDSRLWKQKTHIGFSHFIQQLRKRNVVIMGTTQYIDTIEKRIRQHIDTLIKPTFDEDNQVCKLTIYDLTSLESDSSIPDSYQEYFFAPHIYPYYDTSQIL